MFSQDYLMVCIIMKISWNFFLKKICIFLAEKLKMEIDWYSDSLL